MNRRGAPVCADTQRLIQGDLPRNERVALGRVARSGGRPIVMAHAAARAVGQGRVEDAAAVRGTRTGAAAERGVAVRGKGVTGGGARGDDGLTQGAHLEGKRRGRITTIVLVARTDRVQAAELARGRTRCRPGRGTPAPGAPGAEVLEQPDRIDDAVLPPEAARAVVDATLLCVAECAVSGVAPSGRRASRTAKRELKEAGYAQRLAG
jgi:hypothetical protein